jgi:hypothetical protein
MPRTLLATTDTTLAGVAVTYGAADAANGNYFVNTGEQLLHVKNGSGASITVTVVSVPCSHGRTSDVTVTVPASGDRIIGPFPNELFNQVDTNQVNVNFSAGTSVTVAVIKP